MCARCPASCSSCSRSSSSRARQRARRRSACPRAAHPGLAVLARSHDRGCRELAERPGRDLGAVTVPHVFDAAPARAPLRRHGRLVPRRLHGPATAEGTGWWLRFEQVRRKARVLAQRGRDRLAARNPTCRSSCPATGLKVGQPNLLVVRVDNRRASGTREGWWNWGGITRPVSLVPRGPRRAARRRRHAAPHLRRARRELPLGRDRRRLAREPQPALAAARGAPGAARAGRHDVGGQRRARAPAARRAACACASRSPSRATRSSGSPRTRTSTTRRSARSSAARVIQADRRRDRPAHRRGRQRRAAPQRASVLDLRGASIQEDTPGRGPALTDADVETTVEELKSLGANVTRAHYLLDERLLRRFDEEGILVWSQAPVYHRDAMLKTPGQRSFELDALRYTILVGAQPPVGHHPLGRQRAHAAARRGQDDPRLDAQRRRARARPRPDAAGRDRRALLPGHPPPEGLRRLRPARHQLVLRLVRGQARALDGQPRRPRAVPARDAREVPDARRSS